MTDAVDKTHQATRGVVVLRRSEVMERCPDRATSHSRVWTIRRTELDAHRLESAYARTNLVEMKGRLPYHVHPDADHTLLVLTGRVCAWCGTEAHVLEEGDYISIPAGIAHKYETLTETALLLSFDAPAYDPAASAGAGRGRRLRAAPERLTVVGRGRPRRSDAAHLTDARRRAIRGRAARELVRGWPALAGSRRTLPLRSAAREPGRRRAGR